MPADRSINVVIVTLDGHLCTAAARAEQQLHKEIPGLRLRMHAAADWANDPKTLEACKHDIEQGHLIIVTMIFLEDQIRAILPALEARRESCDAMVCCMAAGEIVRLTKMGSLRMDSEPKGPVALLKKLRGSKKPSTARGAQQMAMLRRLPKILRFIPGPAQDLRAYFLSLQYWLAGSSENLGRMVRYLVRRYAADGRAALSQIKAAEPPLEYPDVGLYHPRLKDRIGTEVGGLPASNARSQGTVGLLVMRSYVLAGNSAHYDAVIAALESKGLRVIPAFAHGLDARDAIERYFLEDGKPLIDALVSLTGFSLVGGPAYNDTSGAQEILRKLDLPYVAAHAIEFQDLPQWRSSTRGLMPIEATMMIAIPELDGATGPMLFGGRAGGAEGATDMVAEPERADQLADRVARLVHLRNTERAKRRLAIVLFNFPPNSGAVGTAAYLSVFESLLVTLRRLQGAGYDVDVPDSAAALRSILLEGNARQYGMDANVAAKIDANDHVASQPWLEEIEAEWGPAPGRQQSNGRSLFILGAEFGNVFVGIQPSFGYEGDPMRLLFERGFAPTHAFAAFYRYIGQKFDAVLHFGTHGALEFMPGKQTGLSGSCWPDRLIGSIPNFYLYAANNPSEGTIAKRRAAATLVSYRTPPLADAGLYKTLGELRQSIKRFREMAPDESAELCENIVELIRTQAEQAELVGPGMDWEDPQTCIYQLSCQLDELEQTLIPSGLHVLGAPLEREVRHETLLAIANSDPAQEPLPAELVERILSVSEQERPTLLEALPESQRERLERLVTMDRKLATNHELDGLESALDGRFVLPAAGGDLLRTSEAVETGRNIHGFDPTRLPSEVAMREGAAQAARLLERHLADHGELPRSIALVLWGSDNLKTEGAAISQALALMGAKPRFDSYGRLCGAELIPLEALGRPRLDVVITLSGIFRDLLPQQTRLLAEAALLAAQADEASSQNFVRAHSLAYQAEHECDLETAALRVFSNADGAYGSNVNFLVDNGKWEDEDELGAAYSERKCFAHGVNGTPRKSPELLRGNLSHVDLAFQNLESTELGITTIDHYFDTLGGISRAVNKARGNAVPVYIGDDTQGAAKIRTLSEQVALETRTRALNPKWYEAMLEHGYEGVRNIEASVTNTLGWSATTGQVAPWVYQKLTRTFMLDEELRERMAALNPVASLRVAQRLLEAHDRNYWSPSDEELAALQQAGEEFEDRIEGIQEIAA